MCANSEGRIKFSVVGYGALMEICVKYTEGQTVSQPEIPLLGSLCLKILRVENAFAIVYSEHNTGHRSSQCLLKLSSCA